MNVLVTGADGFIGKNLITSFPEFVTVIKHTRTNSIHDLKDKVISSNIIFHLAGVNKGKHQDFVDGNVSLTETIARILDEKKEKTHLIFSSTIHIERRDDYGASKSQAEAILKSKSLLAKHKIEILRLPNIFGKWCKPNYNSVVSTFAHAIANNLPYENKNPSHILKLSHVDEVVNHLLILTKLKEGSIDSKNIIPQHTISLNDLEKTFHSFKKPSIEISGLGSGLKKLLFATFLSFIPKDNWVKDLDSSEDPRGLFSELFHTKNSGQVSFFTCKEGISRGNHWHHTKNEKFIVLAGSAEFKFKNIITHETHSIITSSKKLQEVSTVPGWAHNITNIGEGDLIVALWANEVFDSSNPDTVAYNL